MESNSFQRPPIVSRFTFQNRWKSQMEIVSIHGCVDFTDFAEMHEKRSSPSVNIFFKYHRESSIVFCTGCRFVALLFQLIFQEVFRTRFHLLLLKRTVNCRYDSFEFSPSSKLLYTFSCRKVLDCADLSSFRYTVTRATFPRRFPFSTVVPLRVIYLFRYSDSDSSVSLIFHAKRMSAAAWRNFLFALSARSFLPLRHRLFRSFARVTNFTVPPPLAQAPNKHSNYSGITLVKISIFKRLKEKNIPLEKLQKKKHDNSPRKQ